MIPFLSAAYVISAVRYEVHALVAEEEEEEEEEAYCKR
jgi:hypothetical protein